SQPEREESTADSSLLTACTREFLKRAVWWAWRPRTPARCHLRQARCIALQCSHRKREIRGSQASTVAQSDGGPARAAQPMKEPPQRETRNGTRRGTA